MGKNTKQKEIRDRRKQRVRAKISGTELRPRLSVFRSNRGFYLQIINDEKGLTLVSAHSRELKEADKKKKKVEQAKVLGELLAEKALAKKIKSVVFDRSSYKYHGKVKAIADGARLKGLEF
jgi:large subunit ribosomal protein L18